jgi:hypothetical protein
MLLLGLSTVFAGELVIIDDQSVGSIDLSNIVSPETDVLKWSDVQQFPLSITNAEKVLHCDAALTTVEELNESLTSAKQGLDYMEIEKSLGHLNKIENGLSCLRDRIPVDLLIDTYFYAGVAHSYNDKTMEAQANWRQALLYDPDLVWDKNIEPSGKSLFESTKEDLKTEALSQLVFVPAATVLTIDGNESDGRTFLPAGTHLVQHNALDYSSYLISTQSGSNIQLVSFADFSSDLTSTMANADERSELLKALNLIERNDVKIIESGSVWSVPQGSNKWVEKKIQLSQPTEVALKNNSMFELNPTLLMIGISSVALGSGAVWFADQKAKEYPDASREDQPGIYTTNRVAWFSGTGLTVVGGGCLLFGTFSF